MIKGKIELGMRVRIRHGGATRNEIPTGTGVVSAGDPTMPFKWFRITYDDGYWIETTPSNIRRFCERIDASTPQEPVPTDLWHIKKFDRDDNVCTITLTDCAGFGFDFDWYGWDGQDDPRLRLVTAKTVRKALRILNRHWETDNEEGDAVEEPLPETLTPQEQQERQAQQAKEAEEILRAIARHSI